MAEHLSKFGKEEGVVFVGKAQEKTKVFRTEKRRSPKTGLPYPWIVRSSAMVNHYYVYAVDRDFGPFFLKFCTYFPFNAKLCLNGHEYASLHQNRRTHQNVDQPSSTHHIKLDTFTPSVLTQAGLDTNRVRVLTFIVGDREKSGSGILRRKDAQSCGSTSLRAHYGFFDFNLIVAPSTTNVP